MTTNPLAEAPSSPDLAKLEFSTNWNKKLDCNSYTTLRLANPARYYCGRQFSVYLDGKYIHKAEVTDVKTLTISQINEWIARLDTGYSRQDCMTLIQKMYSRQPIDWEVQPLNLVLLRKLES